MLNKFKFLSTVLVIFLIIFTFDPGFAFTEIKFAVVSDPHVSFPDETVTDAFKLGKKSMPLLENTVAELNKVKDLSFVLLPGDVTQDGEPWNVDELRKTLDEFKAPYFITLGNHEISPVPLPREFPGPPPARGVSKYQFVFAFQGRGYKGSNSYNSFDPIPGLHIINLDTTKTGTWGGHLPPAQIEWLKKDLYLNKGKFIIVYTHHNFVPWHVDDTNPKWKSYNLFMLDNAEQVRKIFEEAGVPLVITGHRHISTRYKEINGVYYFVHPCTSTYPMRYTIYTLTRDRLSWEVKNVPAPAEWWELAKKNFLGPPGKWWRGSDHPETPEGDAKMLKFFEASDFMTGTITFKKISSYLGPANYPVNSKEISVSLAPIR